MNISARILLLSCAFTPTIAWAQEGPAPDDGEVAARTGVEDIVVTAQKRSENLQRVPIAITAVTAQALDRAQIETTQDLTFATPSLNFSQTAVFAQPFIRGIGTDSFSPGNEASVATYIDGVYIANMNAGSFAFNNIERIEVLKGPQGTLYGRNSTGGLLNIITRQPTDGFALEGSASYGNFDTFTAKAYVAGGLGEGVSADMAVNIRSQGKGYYRNLGTGNRVSFEEGTYLRSKLVAEISPDVTLTLSGDYSDYENTLASTRQPAVGSVPALPPGTYSTIPGLYSNTRDDTARVRDGGGSATLNADLGGARLVSITAYRKTKGAQYLDGDDSSAPISETFAHLRYWQFSQELQLLSPDNAPFEWILGLYYLKTDAGWDPVTVFANGAQVSESRLFSAGQSLAGFAQATVNVGDNGKFTAGIRYTYDKKDYRRSFAPNAPAEASWKRPTWRLSYSHQFDPAVMGYLSYNRGYKSGVFNTLFGPPVPVNPEKVDSFEVGVKSELFDRRVRLNVAGFYTDFQNIQVRAQLPGNVGVNLQNAASARIYGIDGDIAAVLSDDFQIQAGFSWIDARYTDFPGAEIYVPKPGGGNSLTIGDASGNPLPRTPRFSGNIGLNYDRRLGDDSRIFANASVYLTDRIYWEPGARLTTRGHGLINATIGYAFPGDRVSIELFGRNINDVRYPNYVVAGTFADRTSYAAPRTYGVQLSFEY